MPDRPYVVWRCEGCGRQFRFYGPQKDKVGPGDPSMGGGYVPHKHPSFYDPFEADPNTWKQCESRDFRLELCQNRRVDTRPSGA